MLLLLLGCPSASVDAPIADTDSAVVDTEVPWVTSCVDETPSELSHDADIQPIWETSCYPCHRRSRAYGDLVLTDAFEEIVDVPSVDVPEMDLVEPGDLRHSYLWHKIVGTHREAGGQGNSMPKEGIELTAEDQDRICRWIRDGARRSRP